MSVQSPLIISFLLYSAHELDPQLVVGVYWVISIGNPYACTLVLQCRGTSCKRAADAPMLSVVCPAGERAILGYNPPVSVARRCASGFCFAVFTTYC
jgi:hypothetical protein